MAALALLIPVAHALVMPPAVGPRALGTLTISEAGLGTLNLALDKKDGDADAAAALRASIEAGCNFVDTAEAYGFGNSERLTAWAAQQAGVKIGCGEGDLHVATKFAPVPWRQGAESVVEACRASAERLGVEQIPLYQIHFPDIIQPLKAFGLERRKDEEYWEGLARCYELGLAANVGVCNYGPTMTARIHEFLAARGIPLASNQINYSLMYRKDSAATIAKCNELGVPVIAYFPLANGLLSGRCAVTRRLEAVGPSDSRVETRRDALCSDTRVRATSLAIACAQMTPTTCRHSRRASP